MKKSLKKKLSLLATPIVLLAANTNVMADFCFKPIIGADLGLRHQSYSQDFGGNVAKKNSPQGDVYLGLKFHDYFGIQAGFEATTSRRRTSNFTGPHTLFGVPTFSDSNESSQYISTTNLYGWHADFVTYLPISYENCIDLIGTAGIARLRYRLSSYPTILDNEALSSARSTASTLNFVTTKYVARLGLGLQQMVSDCAGVRLMVNWEDTSKFSNLTSKEGNVRARVTLKDSTIVALGVFYSF